MLKFHVTHRRFCTRSTWCQANFTTNTTIKSSRIVPFKCWKAFYKLRWIFIQILTREWLLQFTDPSLCLCYPYHVIYVSPRNICICICISLLYAFTGPCHIFLLLESLRNLSWEVFWEPLQNIYIYIHQVKFYPISWWWIFMAICSIIFWHLLCFTWIDITHANIWRGIVLVQL